MQTLAMTNVDGQVIWHNAQILPQISPKFFDLDWHRSQSGVLGSAPGRGRAHFLRVDGRVLVLRPFRRGGLIGKLFTDRYLRLGATSSRAFREYSLLEWMFNHGLPVPRPIAARYMPRGLFYRADLVTECISRSRTLADTVADAALPSGTWAKIGAVVGQMHALGVYHSDLNCRNILLDADMQGWLIDFDKCRRREKGRWQSQNLARLKRSLEKESAKQPEFFWRETDWSEFLAGYEANHRGRACNYPKPGS